MDVLLPLKRPPTRVKVHLQLAFHEARVREVEPSSEALLEATREDNDACTVIGVDGVERGAELAPKRLVVRVDWGALNGEEEDMRRGPGGLNV